MASRVRADYFEQFNIWQRGLITMSIHFIDSEKVGILTITKALENLRINGLIDEANLFSKTILQLSYEFSLEKFKRKALDQKIAEYLETKTEEN
jgi:hypothetical protein